MKKYVPIIRKGDVSKVYLDKIFLIEQELRKTKVYTEEDIYWIYGKVGEFLKYLDERFLQCHHSCIINLDKVIRMKEQTIIFEDGHKITMGRESFQQARRRFEHHITRK